MRLERLEELLGNIRPIIILKSTGAIGDAVIVSAVQHALHQVGYNAGLISAWNTLPLWYHLPGVESSLLFDAKQDPPQYDPNNVVDVSQYLIQFPHSLPLPGTQRMGHLSEWMGIMAAEQLGIPLNVSRDNVRVALTAEEAEWGRDEIHARSHVNGNKPVVIISPNSGTKNRSLPSDTVEELVRGLEGKAVAYLLEPVPDMYGTNIPRIGNKDLRKVGALLWAADVYVGADSGPLHIAAGSLQGTSAELSARLSTNNNLGKIVVAVGSSHPDVVSYRGNRIVSADGGCQVAPCGAHGYVLPDAYAEHFTRLRGQKFTFNPTAEPLKEKSGCIQSGYAQEQTALCMKSIPAEAIVSSVLSALGK